MSLMAFVSAAVGALWRERRYTTKQMQAVQRRRLGAMLSWAKDSTVLGAERLADVDPEHPDLSLIAPISKVQMMARFDDSIAHGAVGFEQVQAFTEARDGVGRALLGRYICATTSGTTGRVGTFVADTRSWAQINGALFARILRHRLIPSEVLRFSPLRRYRMAMMVATGGHFITKLVSMFQPLAARGIMKMQAYSITDPLQTALTRLNRYRPHYLHSYPTYLEMLAHAQLSGRLKIDPEFISLGSEPVSALARQTLARAFPNAEISETYGATECLTLANQCRLGRLHANTDLCVLEPVDAEGQPVPPGVASDKVLVTNLFNRAQPLIRYELNDAVTVLDEVCPCGAGLPVIRVEGRSDDTFYLRDAGGRFHVYPPVPFEVVFLDVRGLEQYQLIHEVQNSLTVRLVLSAGASAEAVKALLVQRFETLLSRDDLEREVQLRFEWVPELTREVTGHKLRQVISRVPRPELVHAG